MKENFNIQGGTIASYLQSPLLLEPRHEKLHCIITRGGQTATQAVTNCDDTTLKQVFTHDPRY